MLKNGVKIHYVNEQGLAEAGIDENGVFKVRCCLDGGRWGTMRASFANFRRTTGVLLQEFLEETLKEAFHPDFNLFSTSPDNRLYPSPTSSIHGEVRTEPGFSITSLAFNTWLSRQHLELFEYVGRMLGKAVYEGIIIDVPFAPFFGNAMVGRANALAELPGLDPELSKNLQFVKTFAGDVADLALSFAVDDTVFGEHVTTSLLPGGSALDVTAENRILYIHLVADYRLNKWVVGSVTQVGRTLISYHYWVGVQAAQEADRGVSARLPRRRVAPVAAVFFAARGPAAHFR